MATGRGCLVVLSSSLRLPAHWAQLVAAPHARGVALKTQSVPHCRPRHALTSTDEHPAASVSHPSRSTVTAFSSLRHPKNTSPQLGTSKAPHPSCPFSQRAAAVSSSLPKHVVSTRRSMATLQLGAPASPSPAAFAPPEREKPTVGEVSRAATADSPALIHHRITSEQQLLARMNALKTYMLAANWQDYLSFVLNSAFWEAEMRLLEVEACPFKNSSSRVEAGLRDLRRLFDLMAQASDVRDHINQILELSSRATGLAGTGLNASEKVDNFEDHVQAAVTEYDRLLKEYPEYCSLVDDCLGSGLAMMRQKQRFTFSALHRFFY